MKIHFAALVGIDYDLDLMIPWSRYYLDRKLDSYTVVLHRESGNIPDELQADYRNAGFRVLCADGPFSAGAVRCAMMNNIADNLPGDDILVTSDADEFQAMPDGSPIDYRSIFRRYNMLHGLHEDRYAPTMEDCFGDPFDQYTLIEPYTGEYLKKACVPFIPPEHSPLLVRTKILGAPAGCPVEYKGSHCVKILPAFYRILFDCKVIHFAWRESSARKIALKYYYKKEGLSSVYKNRIPPELVDVYNTVNDIINPERVLEREKEYAV